MNAEPFVIKSLDDIKDVVHYLYTNFSDKPLEVVIKEYKSKRTIDQNQLFHLWMDEIAEQRMDKGWTPPEVFKENGKPYSPSELVKAYYKDKFLPTVEIKVTDKTVITQKLSTSDLDTGQMSHFMQMIDEHCASTGISLTIPERSQYYKNQQKQGNKV